MISIYEYSNYREFLKNWIEIQKNSGRGQISQLAKKARVSTTLISLILKGDKHLSLDQASDLADLIGLNDAECEFFFLLVEHGRAGTASLQHKLKKRILSEQAQAQKISKHVQKDMELTDETNAIYYSNWIYTGVRNLTALNSINSRQDISERLQIPLVQINKIVDFLLENNLCRIENEKLTYGPANTHIDSESPFVVRHHQNWRLRGFQSMSYYDESHIFYTCPMSVSTEAADEIRKMIPKIIKQIIKVVGPSKSEKVYCFNMDWFQY